MDQKLLEEFLEKTLDDGRLSRSESSCFKELLQDAPPDQREVALLHSRIFALAAQRIKHPHDRLLLEWIEDTLKSLRSATTTPTESERSEAYFFPDHQGYRRLLQLIEEAQKKLDVCVFTITDNNISRALARAHHRGVALRIITDDEKCSDLGSDVIDLARYGVAVRFDNGPEHMHHKFALFDKKLLLTGSFNWTRSAVTANRENILVTDDAHLLRRYQEEFDRLWLLYGAHP